MDSLPDSALNRFLKGQSSDDEAKKVARWLEQNPQAIETVPEDVENDTMLQAIRSAAVLSIDADWNVESVIQKVHDQSSVGNLPDPSPAFDVPTQLDQFRILRILGRGGMGMVCEAIDERLSRKVAIKIIRSELSHIKEYRERFIQETRAVAAIEHESIVPILSAGEAAGINYIVMPLLRGETLATRLQRGPLSLSLLVKLALDVSAGLQAAHAAKVIHRDVKPSNIWLERTADGSVKRARLLDFGLARSLSSDDKLTKTHQVMGTPGYMAPELARGNLGGRKSDLFSLGCVLYEAAAGHRPFKGNNMLDVFLNMAETQPTPISSLRPELPKELSDIIERLLAVKPEQRPGSPQEVVVAVERLAHQLDRALDGSSAAKRTRSSVSRGDWFAGHSKAIWGSAGALGVCVLLGVLITIRQPNGTETKIQTDGDAKITMRATGDVVVELSSAKPGNEIKPTDYGSAPTPRQEAKTYEARIQETKTQEAKTQEANAPAAAWDEKASFDKLRKLGIEVRIRRTDGSEQSSINSGDFLAGSRIFGINAASNSELTDDIFETYIAPLRELRALDVTGASRLVDSKRFFQGIGRLTQLNQLSTNLDLDDYGCERLGQCTELTGLYWASARFTEVGARQLLKLTKLSDVRFLGGVIRDTAVDPLLGLPLLQFLTFKNCDLTGQVFKGEALVPTITEIDLSYSRFTHDPLPFLTRFPKLSILRFEAYPSSGKNLKYLSDAPNLRLVDFHSSLINDSEGITALARAPRLETIAFHASPHIGDEHVRALAAAKPANLTYLELSKTQVTDASLDAILTLPRLRLLGLWGVDVTDAGFSKLASSTTLRELHIGSKTLSKATLQALAARDIPWDILWIFSGQLADDSIEELAKMKDLRTLGIADTQISPEGFQRLKTLLPNTQINR